MYVNCINFCIQKGQLTLGQRRGLITLIPKKDKNRIFLKNWRPITLLNSDYKILAKALANRLCTFLPDIISEDQTGYIKGRFIGCNIRLVEDIMQYVELNKLPGIILTIDFEKAFDSICHTFLDESLQAFNFGPQFRSLVSLLYKDISSAVLNNSETTDWFYPTRGVRQGCPISPYLFIIAVELLAISIRSNKDIKGIQVFDREVKIGQLADDTTCFLSNIQSIETLLKVFDNFRDCSGLKVNIDKTKGKFIGQLKTNETTPYGLDWLQNEITLLGVSLTGNENDHYILNFKKRLKSLKYLLASWKSRNLSLKGKITVINNLALPPFLYLASIIHVPERVYDEVKELIVEFLWESKHKVKIAYNVLIQEISDGGLKLMDLREKTKALKAIWVKRMFQSKDTNWLMLCTSLLKINNFEDFFLYNQALENHHTSSLFYSDILHSWSEVKETKKPTLEQIKHEIIWNNRYITIQNAPIYWKKWHEKGIRYVCDLLNDNGTFMTPDEVQMNYNINISFFDMLQIRQSIPHEWRQIIYATPSISKKCQFYPHNSTELFVFLNKKYIALEKISTKDVYQFYIRKLYMEPAGPKRWNKEFSAQITDQDIWPTIYSIPFRTVRKTSLQSLQYKVIHYIINCQKKLCDWKISESPTCKFCPDEDSLIHFFATCPKIKEFWSTFFSWWKRISDTNIELRDKELHFTILLGSCSQGEYFDVLNFCLLSAKHYIYIKRLFHDNKVDFFEFLIKLKYKLKMEKQICKQREEECKFKKFEFIYDLM